MIWQLTYKLGNKPNFPQLKTTAAKAFVWKF